MRRGRDAFPSPPAALPRRSSVIKATRLNGEEFVINADLIKTLEATPDTIITLTTGDKYVIKDTVEEVIERSITYHRLIRAFPY